MCGHKSSFGHSPNCSCDIMSGGLELNSMAISPFRSHSPVIDGVPSALKMPSPWEMVTPRTWSPSQVSWGQESTFQCRIPWRHEFDPWVGQMTWKKKWQPTSASLPGESHGQRSLGGDTVHAWQRDKHSGVTKHACMSKHFKVLYRHIF